MKIVKLPQALIDLVESADYFAKDSPETADEIVILRIIDSARDHTRFFSKD